MHTAVKLSPDIDPAGLMISDVRIWESSTSSIDVGALVPDIDTLQPLDPELREAITATPDTMPSALIEVFRPPDDLLRAAQEHSQKPSEQALGRLATGGETYGAEYILQRWSPANRLVATVWLGTDQAPGMHVDGRDKLPAGIRIEQSRRRLGLNAGPGRRWLLACLPDVVTMAYALGEDASAVPGNDEFRAFVEQHSDQLECIWIPLPPGWAYKMPSDCMGHDGSTFGADAGSHMYYFLGHWTHSMVLQRDLKRLE